MNPRIAGMIWTEQEGMIELNDLIDTNSGLYVEWAGAINDYGQITGRGGYQAGELVNWGATFRLDPIPPRLTIAREEEQTIISWSPAWPGIVLEATESLAIRDWQPMDTGDTNVVTLSMEERQQFFRLNLDAIQGLCCPPE